MWRHLRKICSVCWNVETATSCSWYWRISTKEIGFYNQRAFCVFSKLQWYSFFPTPKFVQYTFLKWTKVLPVGFKISSWFGLGERILTLLLFAANYSKHQTSFSVCQILCKRNWKGGHFEEVTPKRRYQFGDVVMSKGWKPKIISWKPEIISRHTNLGVTCGKLSQATTR